VAGSTKIALVVLSGKVSSANITRVVAPA